MKDWWQNLSQRERYIASIGSSALVVFISYFYLWSPFTQAVVNMKQQVTYQQQLTNMMQQAIIQLQHQQRMTERHQVAATQLLSLIATHLKQHNLANYPHQLDQTQDGKVRLEFKKIPFDLFISWLISFWQQYIFDIATVTLTPLTEIGTVKLTIILKI